MYPVIAFLPVGLKTVNEETNVRREDELLVTRYTPAEAKDWKHLLSFLPVSAALWNK